MKSGLLLSLTNIENEAVGAEISRRKGERRWARDTTGVNVPDLPMRAHDVSIVQHAKNSCEFLMGACVRKGRGSSGADMGERDFCAMAGQHF